MENLESGMYTWLFEIEDDIEFRLKLSHSNKILVPIATVTVVFLFTPFFRWKAFVLLSLKIKYTTNSQIPSFISGKLKIKKCLASVSLVLNTESLLLSACFSILLACTQWEKGWVEMEKASLYLSLQGELAFLVKCNSTFVMW